MTSRHVIDLALDLARMPALARSSVTPPLPADVVDLIRIAAASPKACQAAEAATGEPVQVIIEAARFYLQQLLFRPEADSYRVLGLQPGASRATARTHMRWLLQWLHPDRNSALDAVYAERVLKAWREVSHASDTGAGPNLSQSTTQGTRRPTGSLRLPWIKQPIKRRRSRGNYRSAVRWAVPVGLAIVVLALCSAVYYHFGLDPTFAKIAEP